MNVTVHRPVRRRIEIGSAPADRRRSSEITEALSGVGPTERDRIWKLVVQDALGVSAPAQGGEAQLIEARQHQIEEICRSLGGGSAKPAESVAEGHLPSYGAGLGDEAMFLTVAQAFEIEGEQRK